MNTKIKIPNAIQMDQMNEYLAQLCINTGKSHQINTWADIQNIVRAGVANQYFNVGDVLKVQKGNSYLTFDILDFDYDTPVNEGLHHSMTLGLHDIETYSTLSFDAKEAFYTVAEGSTLQPGAYCFKVVDQPWYADDKGKFMKFTLTTAAPAGTQFVLSNSYNATMVGANVQIYSGPKSTTVVENCVISGDTVASGTNLGELKNAFNGQLNSVQRALLGNNRFSQSANRQYLNSDLAGASGVSSWWEPKNQWDRPQTTNRAGFLNGVDSEFIAVLAPVKKRTALNTVCDGGGYEDTEELIFSQSRAEIFGNAENSVWETSFGVDGSTSPKTVAYKYWQGSNNADRIKYEGTTARYYWMRSPRSSYAHVTRSVSTDGSLNDSGAYGAGGVVPACVIA